MLDIFPISDGQPLPCGPALAAAEEALANLDRLNAGLSRPLHIGLALHHPVQIEIADLHLREAPARLANPA